MESNSETIKNKSREVTENIKSRLTCAIPDLKYDDFVKCKVLLLGSGTLGCNIARQLLRWGITNITFVDNGKVSYSNLVRQSLFVYEDVKSNSNKAEAACKAILRILPSANAKGINLTIRMPGHRFDSTENCIKDIKELENLILSHDVSFLLTDSREARWLPTLISTIHEMPVINSALGTNTFVVMRHGLPAQTKLFEGNKKYERLGCYFCSSGSAPVDTISNRPLDQRCTVTLPSVSLMASGISVDLLASIYNHPLKFLCPAVNYGEDVSSEGDEIFPKTVIGDLPQQIRGCTGDFSVVKMYSNASIDCVACGSDIVDKCSYKDGLKNKLNYENIVKCLQDTNFLLPPQPEEEIDEACIIEF